VISSAKATKPHVEKKINGKCISSAQIETVYSVRMGLTALSLAFANWQGLDAVAVAKVRPVTRIGPTGPAGSTFDGVRSPSPHNSTLPCEGLPI
jgi:hypothetical protein